MTANIDSLLGLTVAQQEVWIADQLDPTHARHNCAGFLDIRGPLQLDLLAAAVERAVGETEALQVRLAVAGEQARQTLQSTPAPVQFLDLSTTADGEQAAWNWMRADLASPVDLLADPLFAHAVLRLAPERHFFYFRYHHIVLDGFGQALYWQRLAEIYTALSRGVPPAPPVAATVADLVQEDQAYQNSAQLVEDRNYWLNTLADPPEPVTLRERVAPRQPSASRFQPWTELGSARAAAATHGTHWSVLVLAAVAAYVARITQQTDVVLGFPVRARTSRQALSTPGMLANVLPLRLRVDGAAGFDELVAQVGRRVGELLQHQRYRGEQLQREFRAADGSTELTGVAVNLIAFDLELVFGQCTCIPHQISSGPVHDLSIEVFGGADGSALSVAFEANPALHQGETVRAHRDRFVAFCQRALVAEPGTQLRSLELLEAGERELLLARAVGPRRDYDLDRTVPELILRQAASTPDAPAATSTGQALSYAELAGAARRLAQWLVSHGVRPGDVVGVHAERDTLLVVQLLGVMLAGAAYLPLDPELPPARLAFLSKDAGCRQVLSRTGLLAGLAGLEATVTPFDSLLPTLTDRDVPLPAVDPTGIAYVIYTSGSTGQPKGVAVPHRGLLNRLLWMQEEYQLQPAERVLQKTPFTFDVSVWEFFWPLLVGASVHLADPGAHRDPRRLAELIRAERISTVHFVPSMLELFLVEPAAAELPSLRRVVCSGEALPPHAVAAFFDRYGPDGPQLYNLYGPTEAAIDVSHWRCTPADTPGGTPASGTVIPIGRPVANTALLVLDDDRQLVPFGVPGELYIGGVQVAAGYLNRPELTERSFVPNPYGAGRLYRTGDVVTMRPDGVLLYQGRTDDQVKVHGFRIEPGEIIEALLRHPAVEQAAVSTPIGPDGQRQLIGYLVAPSAPTIAELQAWLRDRLPPYMVPGQLVLLDELPLLSNGKLDRAALAAQSSAAQSSAAQSSAGSAAPAEQPHTPEQRLVAQAWAEVLGSPPAGLDDSFFALGGDSMHAIRVRAAVERHGYTFAVHELFANPSVRQLAGVLRRSDGAEPAAASEPFSLLDPRDRQLLPADVEDAYPISSMQAGMLFHAAYAENSSVYRVVTSIRISTGLRLDALRLAIGDTLRRHPSLRCSFDLTGYSEPLQLVHRDVEVPLEVAEELVGLDRAAQTAAIQAWAERAKFSTFDPARAPLLRFTVHPLGPDAFELSVVEHHVILDGWSDMRMLEEVVEHYRARAAGSELRLPPVGSSYRQFIAAEREIRADEQARRFWYEQLAGVEPSLVAPEAQAEQLQAAAGDFVNERYDVELPAELGEQLRRLATAESLPLKSLLVTAHLAVLRLVTGQDEILTGLIANARLEQAGGDEAVGVFLNTLPLRLELSERSLVAVARAVFAFEQQASAYRRYPFAQMQHDVGDGLQLDSYVNYMDFRRERRGEADGLMSVTVGVAETNYPLAANFLVDPEQGRLQLWLDCGTSRELAGRFRQLPGYYRRALQALAERPEAPITGLDLLSDAEQAELAAWNDTAADYDRTATLSGLITEQARLRPDKTALVHRDDRLSYAQLDARANQLAHQLISAGVRPGDRVGICQRRSVELMVSLLAVLKAGGAYVPMDAGYPLSRLQLIADDADLRCLVTGLGTPDGVRQASRIDVVEQAAEIAAQPVTAPEVAVGADDLAYVIYTSGSTGKPKGTGIRHRNVVNFFRGMADTVGCEERDVLLAVTSVSFDISVLELFWPLTRGATVVLAGENIVANLVQRGDSAARTLGFSLFFFAASAGESNRDGYRLVLEAAKYADTHGFEAVWTPERHFHAFGGLYPNPSVMSAALATITSRIGLRSGSVVAPLHETVRIAEEWSLVDNLSNGRVGLAFAPGWNSNDFVIRPENFADRREIMGRQLEEFGRLWRGEPVQRIGGSGETVDVTIFPAPVQPMPQIWLTSVGAVQTFQRAGALGANLLTHLLGQDPAELAEKIKAYRQAREEAGHPGPGRVTAMVHTYLAEDTEEARRRARAPFANYLRSSTELWRTVFATTNQAFPELNVEEHLDAVIDLAIDRYFESSGLFGSPETVTAVLDTLVDVGVDEVACLVDFGLPPQDVLDGLHWVDRLRDAHETEVAESRHSLAALCERHGVTMLQGTPSLLTAVAGEPGALEAIGSLRALLIGGEAFPSGLAQRLLTELPDVQIFNMYGPTETTIWSTVHRLSPADADGSNIPIGRPIANTEVLVADSRGMPAPAGRSGELWIGGDGVAVGYLGRPELTAERFVQLAGRTYYRTGDRVRWRPDGVLEFLGRVDRQVKILGHRIEPDEIESVLSRHPQVAAAAVKAVAGTNGPELVAYVSPAESATDVEVQQAHVQRWGEAWDSAYTGSDAEAGTLDFAGWLSSYTGEPIPEAEMREWLDRTVERLQAFGPTAVADVGVGVGLILRSFADRVEEYHGLDLSAAALRSAARCLGPNRPLPESVRLVQSGPEYLRQLPADSLDLVVINSVAQYFPSLGYLRTVLTDAVRAVSDGGAVFVGDVRSLELLPEFHTAVQLHRAAPLQTVDELRSAILHRAREERELCVSPQFFRQLATELPQVTGIRLELKRGWADNELSQFRYDVSLLIGSHSDEQPRRRVDFAELANGLADVSELLAAEPAGLAVTGIVNRRLTRPGAAVRQLAELPGTATAWDLERLLWEADTEAGIHPEELHRLAAAAGRMVRLVVPPDGRLDRFDAVFTDAVFTDAVFTDAVSAPTDQDGEPQ